MNFKSCCALFVFAVTCLPIPLDAQENLEVKGLGFFKNMAYKKRLAFLQNIPANEPTLLNAAFLEDSAYLLLQQLKRNGYLKPKVEGIFQVGDVTKRVIWKNDYQIQLPTEFLADHATFNLLPGVLYYYKSVEVDGVPTLDERTVRRYFISDGVLFAAKSSQVFTESNFEQRINRLLKVLQQMGYRKAKLVEKKFLLNDDTGAVTTTVSIDPGPLHRVGQVVVEWIDATGAVEKKETENSGSLFTAEWERSQRQALINAAYGDGYADVELLQTKSEAILNDQNILITDVHYQVRLNSVVEFGGVQFLGDDKTKSSVLRRYVKMSEGDPLNPLLANESRRNLLGLGIFKEVEMSYEPEDGDKRTVIYNLIPATRKELDLLAGWGSYELARIGFRWNQKNPFGRAHKYELSGKQSFRSTLLETTYSVPQFMGSELTAYTSAEYSFREEISFDRSTKGLTTGLSKTLAKSDIMLALEYGYAREDIDRKAGSDFDSEEEARVGSLSAKINLDRRDSFLAPTIGSTLYSKINVASKALGGTVDFLKIELGASYHDLLFHESVLLHLGFRTGAIFSENGASNDIPFAERFFNGGENTVRGYQQGEASPLDTNGEQIGAESFLLLNIELEKRMFQNVSFIGFFDTVTNARDGFFEDEVESLSSVGVGFRYQSLMGPIRLEYGHNLNPRVTDPNGTLHFSIGFPF